jgi:hypothetical protein
MIMVRSWPQAKTQDLTRKTTKRKKKRSGACVTEVLEHLPSKAKALISNSSTTKE